MTADELAAKARALAQAESDGNEILRMLEWEEADRRRLEEHMEPFYRFVGAEFIKIIKEHEYK